MRTVTVAACLGFALTVGAQAASAAVLHVNSTADTPGCSPGTCTLRGAIASAAGGDTVDVPGGT